MILRAKIKSEYLDQILSGKKREELRQFEAMKLTDELGREALVEIKDIENAGPLAKTIMEMYPDIAWIPDRPIYVIELGRILNVSTSGSKAEHIKRAKELRESADDDKVASGIFMDSVDP